MKIEIEIPSIRPEEWKQTKDRALAAFAVAKEQLKEAKASVLEETGQGSCLGVGRLVPEELRLWFNYIPAHPIDKNGKPITHVTDELSDEYPHYPESHKTLLATAMAFEAICAEEGAIRRMVMNSVA